jgi:hypothetical protein
MRKQHGEVRKASVAFRVFSALCTHFAMGALALKNSFAITRVSVKPMARPVQTMKYQEKSTYTVVSPNGSGGGVVRGMADYLRVLRTSTSI